MGAGGPLHSHGSLSTPCSEQRLQAELQSSLNAEQQRKAEAQAQLEQATRAMQTLREGLEQLAGKLDHLTMGSQVPEKDPQVGVHPIAPLKGPPPSCPIQDIRSPLRRESLPHVPGVTPLLRKWPKTSESLCCLKTHPQRKVPLCPPTQNLRDLAAILEHPETEAPPLSAAKYRFFRSSRQWLLSGYPLPSKEDLPHPLSSV